MQPQFRPPGPERAGFAPPTRPPAMNRPGMNYPPPGPSPSQFSGMPPGPPGGNPHSSFPQHPPTQKMAGLSLAPNTSENNSQSQPTVSNGMTATAPPPNFPGTQAMPTSVPPSMPPMSNPSLSQPVSSPSPQTFVQQHSSPAPHPAQFTNGSQIPASNSQSVANAPPSSMPPINGPSNAVLQSGVTQNPTASSSLSQQSMPSQLASTAPGQSPHAPMGSVHSGQPTMNSLSSSFSQGPMPTMSNTGMSPRPATGVFPPMGAPQMRSPSMPPGPAGMRSMTPAGGMRPPMPPMSSGVMSPGISPMPPMSAGGMSPMPPMSAGGMSPMPPMPAGGMSPMPPMSTAGMSPMPPMPSGGMPPMPTRGLSPGMAPRPAGAMPPMPPSATGMSPGMTQMPPSATGMSPAMPQQTPGPRIHTGMPGAQYPPQSMNRGPPIPGSQPQIPQGGMQNRYPGSAQMGGGMGAYSQGQGRKLNPDDMPSPLQVIEDDQKARSGEFFTHAKGDVPPLVTTKFVVRDSGNASPRFMRSTMYSVPATPDMMKRCAVPFGVAISPYADVMSGEDPLYLGTSLTNGPVRCNRCKAYMSPLMRFMDGGRRFQCLLCKQANEVPSDYYCHMDSQGARADKFQRPELCRGSFEYVATPEYCTNKLLPKEPAFIFAFEMSQMMLQRGIINLLCQNMKTILQNLPKDEVPGMEPPEFSKIHVGFITYDSSVHFYKLSGLSPEMCIVCDKENMFVPVPDGILCDAQQVADNLDKLMESIPQNFQSSKETSGNLHGAINAGMAALKASGRSGKLFVFHSSLPQGEGLGKLKSREDRKVLGTEKEKAVLSPQNNHYNNLAQELVTAGCGVDLYLFNESYMDFATIGQVPRLTGGQIHKYTHFTVNRDGQRLLQDLEINVGRKIAFDAVMRVRTSTGVRPVDFYGHFFMSNTHDVELAVIDSSKAIAVEIKHDDKITEEDGVYIQAALLYTSCGGQRRLRILNLSLNVCDQMADMYKNSDLDTIMNLWTKESICKLSTTSSKQIKDNLINKTAETLACYRKHCASPSSAGQLILPEQMKLLPLFVNCLSRSDALSGGSDLTCDDRSWHMYQVSTMKVSASLGYLYPRLLPLLDADVQDTELPAPLRTSYSKLRPDGVFLLENGLFMFIWVGSGTPSSWMSDVFGVSAPHQLDPVMSELPELNNPNSEAVRRIVEQVRTERGMHLRLFVVPQQGKHELVLRNYLVEDVGVGGAPGYVEFLCHVHKEIRTILS